MNSQRNFNMVRQRSWSGSARPRCPKYGPPARADTQIFLGVVGNDQRRRPQTWSVSALLGVKILTTEADSRTRSSGEPYLGFVEQPL